MQNVLLNVRLTVGYGGGFNSGDIIAVYWDDVTAALVVNHLDSAGVLIGTITTGPDLGQLQVNQVSFVDYDTSSVNRQTGQINAPKFFNSQYKFCSGFTLVTFFGVFNNPSFPYCQKLETPNASECAVQICDLHFTGIQSITHPTNSASLDGAFTVTAVSSHGTVEYSTADLAYGAGNNTTGIFTGRSMGRWTVYARDQYNCKATISIDMIPGAAFTTDVKYRIDYKDLNGNDSRIDIVQTGFNGTPTELVCSGTPIQISKPNVIVNDKFTVLHPTSAIVGLISVTNYQYIGLFSQDDRRYQVKFYKGAVLMWTGFVIPSVYNEAYINPPYTVFLGATDGVKQLDNLDFLSDDGNRLSGSIRLIELVAFIFKKLGLNLSFKVAINMYASGFTTAAADDPLDQAYINDMDSFYEDDGTPWKCTRVIEAIIAAYGAKIVQSLGYWNIIHVEEQTDNYDYRIFDSSGNYASNATSDHIIEINDPSLGIRALWRDSNQILEIVPAYGKIKLTHNLTDRKNLLVGGAFELDDWNGAFFDGWNINLQGGAGTYYGVKKIVSDRSLTRIINIFGQISRRTRNIESLLWKNSSQGGPIEATGGSSYALRLANIEGTPVVAHPDFGRHTGAVVAFTSLGKNVYINSLQKSIDYFKNSITFSFKYRINLNRGNAEAVFNYSGDFTNPHWVRVRWRVNVDIASETYSFNEKLGWLKTVNVGQYPDPSEFYNKIYESNFNSDQSKQFTIDLPSVAALQTNQFFSVGFWFEGVTSFDALSFANLQAIVTVDKVVGNKAKIAVNDTIYYYNLRIGTDATSSPNILRPGDYNAGTNPVVWELEHSDKYTDIVNINEIYLDDAVLLFNPGQASAPQSEVLTLTVNENFKENLDVIIDSGDLPDTQIDSAKYVYENYFQNAAGVPTSGWKRDYIAGESLTIQKILLKSIAVQYSKPTFKLSGSIFGKSDLNFLSILKHTQDPDAAIVVLNQDFATGASWANSGGADWAISAGNAVYTYTGGTVNNANYFIQTGLTLPAGSRISIDIDLTRSGANTSRSDVLYCVLMSGSSIVQKVALTPIINGDGQMLKVTRVNIGQDCDTIGFFIYTLSGTGNLVYTLTHFLVTPITVVRFYELSSFTYSDKDNKYDVELLQLIPPVPNTDPTIDDTGGGDIDGTILGGGSGRAHSSGFSSGFS